VIYIVLDIETIAHPDAHLWVDDVKPDGRLKDPEKIAADIIEKNIERDKTFALHPDTNLIVALGYHIIGHSDDPHCLLMRDAFEAKELLRSFWEEYRALDRRQEVRFVTFNGLTFDIPTLLSNSLWLDVEAPNVETDKYRSPHAEFDVMWRLSRKGVVKPHSLKFYAKRAGLPLLDKVNGSEIAQMVKDEDWTGIEAHCMSDVGLTHALANRLKLLRM